MARQDDELDLFEEDLIEAWRNMARLPDRERGWLASGQRSWWPDIVRDRMTDYADTEARPRRQLSRRELRAVERFFINPDCLVMIVPEDRRPLVAVVLSAKAWPQGRDLWSQVWQAMGGKACGATSDALRSRYETQLRRMAFALSVREAALGVGVEG